MESPRASLDAVKTHLLQKGIPIKKGLSQNFLINVEAAFHIVSLLHNDSSVCIEIGPGIGALTEQLLKTQKVIAIEKDADFLDALSSFTSNKDFTLVHHDARLYDFSMHRNFSLVTNAPYSISLDLLRMICSLHHSIVQVVCIFQKEYVQKVTEAIHPLRYLLPLLFNLRKERILPRSFFYPQPKVASQIIVLSRKVCPPFQVEKAYNFLQYLCLHKKQTLGNTMQHFYQKDWLFHFLKEHDILPSKRIHEVALPLMENMLLSLFTIGNSCQDGNRNR